MFRVFFWRDAGSAAGAAPLARVRVRPKEGLIISGRTIIRSPNAGFTTARRKNNGIDCPPTQYTKDRVLGASDAPR